MLNSKMLKWSLVSNMTTLIRLVRPGEIYANGQKLSKGCMSWRGGGYIQVWFSCAAAVFESIDLYKYQEFSNAPAFIIITIIYAATIINSGQVSNQIQPGEKLNSKMLKWSLVNNMTALIRLVSPGEIYANGQKLSQGYTS